MSYFQQKPASLLNDKEEEEGGASHEAVSRGEGLFKNVPNVLEARRRLHALLEKGGKGRRHEIPAETPVPPHLRKRSASQPVSRIAPLPLETVSEASSQPVVNSLFVVCCAVLND